MVPNSLFAQRLESHWPSCSPAEKCLDPIKFRTPDGGKAFTNPPTEKLRSKKNVLLVEDDPALRMVVREVLKDDFNVDEADNGDTGVEKGVNSPADLSDTRLPLAEERWPRSDRRNKEGPPCGPRHRADGLFESGVRKAI